MKSVLNLDAHLAELERIGAKINSMPMKSEFDRAHMKKLMGRFAECGGGVATEVTNLSQRLNDARARAEAIAQGVAERAALLESVKGEESVKLEQLRLLGEKVRDLNQAMSTLRRPEGEALSAEDRKHIAASLAQFDAQLDPLIAEAQALRQDARDSKMKALEQNAGSLAQTLIVVREKLQSLRTL